MNTPSDLQGLRDDFQKELANVTTESSLEEVRVRFLGRKGAIASLMINLKDCPPDERPVLGKALNELKLELSGAFDDFKKTFEKMTSIEDDNTDYTLPGRRGFIGHKHPLSIVWEEMLDIFSHMGFEVARGPEVETEYYNFTALNFPPNHPARDMQDTFYLTEDTLLRTHTSPVQIRTMLAKPPPVRLVIPGRVYRNEAISARAYCMFNQVEGLYVDKNVSLADLKGTLISFAKQLFGKDVKTRFRPSYFPFTEPSAEMDVSCVVCGGSTGCRICKYTGWVELLGSGMVDPNVLRNVGYDPEEVSGFAWGMGIERITMMKYGIDDLRLFFEGDMRIMEQF